MPKGLGEDKYVANLHGPADRDPVQELANQIDLSDSAGAYLFTGNCGRVERDLGNLEAARTAYRESLQIAQRLNRTFPDQCRYQQDLTRIEARAGRQGY